MPKKKAVRKSANSDAANAAAGNAAKEKMPKKKAARKSANSHVTHASKRSITRTDLLQATFLGQISHHANIATAAQEAGIGRSTHYLWLKDPDYRKRFLEARETAYDKLELEAWKRAFAGSDRLLMFLLMAYRAKFRPDAQPPLSSGDDLADIPDERLEVEAQEEIKKLGFNSLNEVWEGRS
jgi:hypothetical protein